MPHTHAAAKALRQTRVRTLVSKKTKATVAFLRKRILRAVNTKDKSQAETYFKELQKKIDKAVKRNVIHKNAASRKKARLAKRILSLG